MPIRVLDKEISELIAAGEVVERPASVVKELAENSIDAGASKVEIELVANGLKSIRVTDDGAGIDKAEIPLAFLRHATSKVCEANDLDNISTLGFRGEALAAIASVSRVRFISGTKGDYFATEYLIEGGVEISVADTGSDTGTTIVVSDMFYNTPARMKFLKKDVSEGNSVQAVVMQLALSHPEVSFRLIRDGRTVLQTPGNGVLFDAMYALFPKEITENMVSIPETPGHITVSGYVGKAGISRKSRGFQYAFVNGRFVKSTTVSAAAEQAYRKQRTSGNFPVFVLGVSLPYDEVDVNVHPAKTQVRFRNEREVFSAVYHAVLSALTLIVSAFTEGASNSSHEDADPRGTGEFDVPLRRPNDRPVTDSPASLYALSEPAEREPDILRSSFADYALTSQPAVEQMRSPGLKTKKMNLDVDFFPDAPNTAGPGALKIVGEVFSTYIVAELNEHMVLIDKHAAHERILYERFEKNGFQNDRQLLLQPEVVAVSPDEKSALLEASGLLAGIGFVVDEFGLTEVVVRETPYYFDGKSFSGAILDIAAQLMKNSSAPETEEAVRLLHSAACHSAIKAGYSTSEREMAQLAEEIVFGDIPKYCPHGRPICSIFNKREIEKRFGRV